MTEEKKMPADQTSADSKQKVAKQSDKAEVASEETSAAQVTTGDRPNVSEKSEETAQQSSVSTRPRRGGVKVKYATKKKRRTRRQVRRGRAYIKSSYNNTLVLFTDMHGNSLAWSSAGLLGFKGAKKATTYAANKVALDADEKVQKYGLKEISVFVKGVGAGRDAALRTLVQRGYNLLSIKDVTPIPHNGCRPRKPRRV